MASFSDKFNSKINKIDCDYECEGRIKFSMNLSISWSHTRDFGHPGYCLVGGWLGFGTEVYMSARHYKFFRIWSLAPDG